MVDIFYDRWNRKLKADFKLLTKARGITKDLAIIPIL